MKEFQILGRTSTRATALPYLPLLSYDRIFNVITQFFGPNGRVKTRNRVPARNHFTTFFTPQSYFTLLTTLPVEMSASAVTAASPVETQVPESATRSAAAVTLNSIALEPSSTPLAKPAETQVPASSSLQREAEANSLPASQALKQKYYLDLGGSLRVRDLDREEYERQEWSRILGNPLMDNPADIKLGMPLIFSAVGVSASALPLVNTLQRPILGPGASQWEGGPTQAHAYIPPRAFNPVGSGSVPQSWVLPAFHAIVPLIELEGEGSLVKSLDISFLCTPPSLTPLEISTPSRSESDAGKVTHSDGERCPILRLRGGGTGDEEPEFSPVEGIFATAKVHSKVSPISSSTGELQGFFGALTCACRGVCGLFA